MQAITGATTRCPGPDTQFARAGDAELRRGDAMVMCNGCLVLHRDGEIAYCSEELDGNDCAGYELPHLAGVMACRVTPRGSRCQHCDQAMQFRLIMAPDFVPDGLQSAMN
jgi:hypothetical protein